MAGSKRSKPSSDVEEPAAEASVGDERMANVRAKITDMVKGMLKDHAAADQARIDLAKSRGNELVCRADDVGQKIEQAEAVVAAAIVAGSAIDPSQTRHCLATVADLLRLARAGSRRLCASLANESAAGSPALLTHSALAH